MTIVKLIEEPISAAEFKAHCLDLMDQVKTKKGKIVITKYGKPVAQLTALDENPPDLLGYLAGSVTTQGDLTQPTGESWDADA